MCWFLPCETFCSTWINYFRVDFDLCLKTSSGAQHFIWNWVLFPRRWLCKKNTFQYERLCAKTRFETEVRATCNWLIAILMRQTFYILLYSFARTVTCKIVSVTKFTLTIQRGNSWILCAVGLNLFLLCSQDSAACCSFQGRHEQSLFSNFAFFFVTNTLR